MKLINIGCNVNRERERKKGWEGGREESKKYVERILNIFLLN